MSTYEDEFSRVREAIVGKMADPEEAPPAKAPDFLSYNDSVTAFQDYASEESELNKAMQAVIERITIEEAAHAEAFVCECFGISVAEHDEMVAWTMAGAQGDPPPAVLKLAAPIEADVRLARLIAKYEMNSKPERVWVLQRLFSRMTEIHANVKAFDHE